MLLHFNSNSTAGFYVEFEVLLVKDMVMNYSTRECNEKKRSLKTVLRFILLIYYETLTFRLRLRL